MKTRREGRLMGSGRYPAPSTILPRFRRALEYEGLHRALGILNATTCFRFTGVYRFDGVVVMNVVLFDRENPGLRVGEDVRLEESYCRMTAEIGDRCAIVDAHEDMRLDDHAARDAVRSYCAVLLRTEADAPLGTLCHFDVRPRPVGEGVFELLETVRPDVERAVRLRHGFPERPAEPKIADFV